MRPYLVLFAVVLMAVAAFGQRPVQRVYGPCLYGCGPFVPLISTPMLSFETVSPNPVGASNATTGLIAGATNSTLSQEQGPTSSVYTVPVWYQGGAPLITPEVNVVPEPIGSERGFMHEEHARGEHMMGEHGMGAKEERGAWLYYTGSEHTSDAAGAASAAKGSKKATHVYTNDDVTRQNDKNGTVKYDGKTEKM